jgi:Arc/MetJ-type ribon-helix-helix transcriptional regulator
MRLPGNRGILAATGGTMAAIQLPDRLKQVIDRQVAEGRAVSESDYVVRALSAYADHIEAEDEIAAMVERVDADMAAGRFITVTSAEDGEALHEGAMARLHARMARDTEGR